MHMSQTLISAAIAAALTGGAFAAELTPVSSANPKTVGVTSPNVLSPELRQIVAAQGSILVENPTDTVKYYGYLSNVPSLLPAFGSVVEATKTEPDKNTYLVLNDRVGGDRGSDYGAHFLFQ